MRFLIALTTLLIADAQADPCGMVPPVQFAQTAPIERIGAQRTYVSWRNGVETMALRPGFQGKVEEFGMLIPFPSPPAIRKLDDDTFAHLENAVDPPQITVSILDYEMFLEESEEMLDDAPMPMSAAEDVSGLGYNEVNVLREEAVGMYQVAVLEAGSPAALKRWMEDNGYRFPDGMEHVTGEYVTARWCFVAIKAKVGQGPGVTPQPGMRDTQFERPAGSSFDGHVQGMAFRFLTDEPVVPMRLSVFNGVDPRNVVYMLSDDPVRINGVNEALVARQVAGQQLHENLTEPTPVVFQGGTAEDLSEAFKAELDKRRAPEQYNQIARDLFAADLLAVRTGQLVLPHEEVEKSLLNISEALGMRGEVIDGLHAEAVAAERGRAVDGALDDLKEMHLTVIDGVFPQSLLARENLSFATYKMPEDRNNRRSDSLRAQDQWAEYYTSQLNGWWSQ